LRGQGIIKGCSGNVSLRIAEIRQLIKDASRPRVTRGLNGRWGRSRVRCKRRVPQGPKAKAKWQGRRLETTAEGEKKKDGPTNGQCSKRSQRRQKISSCQKRRPPNPSIRPQTHPARHDPPPKTKRKTPEDKTKSPQGRKKPKNRGKRGSKPQQETAHTQKPHAKKQKKTQKPNSHPPPNKRKRPAPPPKPQPRHSKLPAV